MTAAMINLDSKGETYIIAPPLRKKEDQTRL